MTFVSVFDKNKKQNTTAPKIRGGKAVTGRDPVTFRQFSAAAAHAWRR